jgi:hypothetical protein
MGAQQVDTLTGLAGADVFLQGVTALSGTDLLGV